MGDQTSCMNQVDSSYGLSRQTLKEARLCGNLGRGSEVFARYPVGVVHCRIHCNLVCAVFRFDSRKLEFDPDYRDFVVALFGCHRYNHLDEEAEDSAFARGAFPLSTIPFTVLVGNCDVHN